MQSKKSTNKTSETFYSVFSTTGVDEGVIIISVKNNISFFEQLNEILNELKTILEVLCIGKQELRFCRFYVSDILNQIPILKNSILFNFLKREACISIIQQPPLSNSRITVCLRFTKAGKINKLINKNIAYISDEIKECVWTSNYKLTTLTSYNQTLELLENLDSELKTKNASIADNCVRTWFYVSHIDENYKDMVDARNEYFEKIGLNSKTHFIASTGIEGICANSCQTVALESYSTLNFPKEKIVYLHAPDYMNSTSEYGVAFERATLLNFDSYCQIFVSGTASIDNKGNVLFPNDIENQFYRTIENISGILESGNAKLEDVLYFIVYIRDFNDKQIINNLLSERCPDTPFVILLAPVCRPGWLIEIECEAFIQN